MFQWIRDEQRGELVDGMADSRYASSRVLAGGWWMHTGRSERINSDGMGFLGVADVQDEQQPAKSV